MKTVSQRCTMSCVIACAVMLTGEKYERIERFARKSYYQKDRTGTCTFDLFTNMGYAIGSSDKLDNLPCIASVNFDGNINDGHAIYIEKDGNKLVFHDPAPGFSDRAIEYTWEEIIEFTTHTFYLVPHGRKQMNKMQLRVLNLFRCGTDIRKIKRKTKLSRGEIRKILRKYDCTG